MLGAIVVFCALAFALFRWLVNTYDSGSAAEPLRANQEEEQRGRKRNRRKGRQQGKKAAPKGQSAQPPPASNATPAGDVDSKKRTLPRGGASERQPLDAEEWPTLGGGGGLNRGHVEEEEDLAALHAQLLLEATKCTAMGAHGAGAAGTGSAVERGPRGGRVGVGDKVEARFQAGAEWFPAMVTKTLHGGLVNLLYDDGERETRVPLSLVRHHRRGAREDASSDSGSDSEKPTGNGRPIPRESKGLRDGWEVMAPKPKKTSVERVEARVEASSNLKNRLKRHKKREKEIAAREALRKKL